PVQNGAPQPIISTRTISSNIRLKDGETNFLAGLYRTDKGNTVDTIPFVGDIPVLGRLLSHKKTEVKTTDIVLTMTPHIIRIPDTPEEALPPLYVGPDANISFQGSPRIETPGVGGPFDSRQPAPPRGQPAPGTPPAPTNLVPGGLPSDPFRQPQQSIPPQPTPAPRPFGAQTAASATFALSPSTVSIAPGQQVSIVVRATGTDVLPEGSLVLTTDPMVVSIIGARPIFTSAGVSDSQVEPGRAVLQIPSGTPVSGTVP